MPTKPLIDQTEWQALKDHRSAMDSVHMRDLFDQDPDRFQRYFVEAAGLSLDYSKNRITQETLGHLMALARARHLPEQIEALFKGEHVNNTEDRPALHTALRNLGDGPVEVDGTDIMPEVRQTLKRMEEFVWRVRSTQWRGFSNKPFTDVVSIGIGGSFLGPKLVSAALKPYWHGQLNCHYVANIDGSHITEVLRHINPETTLFLIQSKSFRTQETLENTRIAREWFLHNGGSEDRIAKHFVAVTANEAEAIDFGITRDNIFPMWDWVGGRYSLWSAIGLPTALTIGMENFRGLLAGAHAMDRHFREAPLEENMPVIMALLGIWYGNFWDADAHAVLPYDHYLRGLPAHLMQLDMESNGKCVRRGGEPVDWETGPIIWGGAGANGQHAYHQLLHQGTRLSPADFIMPLHTHNPVGQHHAILFANCLSQAQALMRGKTRDEAYQELLDKGHSEDEATRLAPHKAIPGNKPSNTLLFDRATPHTIGALIALYEHKTFTQGAIWDVDSFDQWGVELGKQLGQTILGRLNADKDDTTTDSSTDGLIRLFRKTHDVD
ncbi:glucose-6-phosphate isomerase [Tamilnaduibacter salinus]|uniref:Glucose-6-phosphate isomerase n=1 Tax=Tamilnaduibacter salinus TaxID=1484056 RepID=A0A2U1CXS7_9GAMM|nr:glucose-6-phosphate isomerase [Tamilnaduibacter salinus]PVY77029.1 glucose-6-phosphate isomerase [Tamilnaduibacter salinus]